MSSVTVLSAGLLSTVQDAGRFGWQECGMPTAGAMDRFAHRAGNILVGNAQDTAALEVTLLGPELLFVEDALIAVTGAAFPLTLDGDVVLLWQSYIVKAGQTLSFGAATSGCRGYLCIAGGVAVPKLMGSRSTYLRSKLGGHLGRKLAAGDVLPLLPTGCTAWGRSYPAELIPCYSDKETVRVISGPQEDHFTRAGKEAFFSGSYTVTNEADRMGYRLIGPAVEHKNGADIVSDGLPLGAIQIPGHGQPIIMLSERPTTGGYAKIATVITADIPKVAQLKPGGAIRFQAVNFEQAWQALVEQEKILHAWIEPNTENGLARV